jgi:ribosomal protein S18 acetylase RimI-like enzyme
MMAKSNGCYDITLNVWNLNPTAFKFYEKLGMVPRKVMMEEIL